MREEARLSGSIVLRVFLPFAFGHFLSYVLRMVNAVIAPDLARDIGVDATRLGVLTSAYFLAFAACQLPLGVLLDRYGPRKTEGALILVAALGAVIFAVAPSLETLIVGRILIGIGVSAGLMAAFKANVLWFAKERWPLANGGIMAIGGLGALTATAPIEAALSVVDWRGLFLVFAALTVAASALIWLAVPEKPAAGGADPARPPETLGQQIRGIGRVYSSAVFWRYTLPAIAAVSMMFATQGLWAGPWMRDIAGFDRDQVAAGLLLIAAAQVAGYFIVGWLAGRLMRHGVKTIATAIAGLCLFVAVQLVLLLQLSPWVLPVWFAFGLVISIPSLTYASLAQNFPADMIGRVNTAANVLFFFGAFVAQSGMGAIIDLWPPTATGGYAEQGYAAAFAVMIVLQLVALTWFFVAPRFLPQSRGV